MVCFVLRMLHLRFFPSLPALKLLLPYARYGKPSKLLMLGRLKVPINPKLLFWLNKYMYNSEQNGAKIFELGQNQNFL